MSYVTFAQHNEYKKTILLDIISDIISSMNTTMQKWLPLRAMYQDQSIITDYEIYLIDSDEGCIIRNKSTKNELTMQTGIDRSVSIRIDKKSYHFQVTHIMLLSAFPEVQKLETVDHIDNNPANDRIGNLMWMERSENASKAKEKMAQPKKRVICDIPVNEQWKDFSLGSNTVYEVSDCGRVRNQHTKNISLGTASRSKKYRSYAVVNEDGKRQKIYMHRLVWMAFNGAIDPKLEILHDDRADLLEDGTYRNWLVDLRLGTRSENMQEFHGTLIRPDPVPINAEVTTHIHTTRPRFSDNVTVDIPNGFWIASEDTTKGAIVVVDMKRYKRNGKILHFKSTSSKKYSLIFKREHAKKFVRWIMEIYTDIKEVYMAEEYNEDISELSPCEVELYKQCKFSDPFTADKKASGRNLTSNLPPDCGVKLEDIPKYCYYTPASEQRGDKFVIDKHPKLVATGKRQWSTTGSKNVTTLEKFTALLNQIKEIEATD
jgi:hypothetical protein